MDIFKEHIFNISASNEKGNVCICAGMGHISKSIVNLLLAISIGENSQQVEIAVNVFIGIICTIELNCSISISASDSVDLSAKASSC